MIDINKVFSKTGEKFVEEFLFPTSSSPFILLIVFFPLLCFLGIVGKIAIKLSEFS